MKEPIYAAARMVAPAVFAHFTDHLAQARARGETRLASLADEEIIASLIDVAFWASLRREEGYVPKISLAFVRPDESPFPLLFARPLPLDASALTRVAPAVERPGIHLGVMRDGIDLVVWGTVRAVPSTAALSRLPSLGSWW